MDLLWSDPKPLPGCRPNTFRGGGCYFGPDITDRILRKHDLELLVRSHECKYEGYEYMHGEKVKGFLNSTVFSTMFQNLPVPQLMFSKTFIHKALRHIKKFIGF